MNYYGKASLMLTAAAIAYTAAPGALAQDAGVVEERDVIVVTARKKEESILEAPLAITALGADELAAADISNILEVADATPGFHIDAFQFYPGRFDSVPIIRGVVIEDDDPTTQTVSVFMDGAYVAGGTKGIGVEDIERIEVIKGPQSALFGRTTFAGAINYVTKDPGDEFKGRFSGTVATRDEYEAIVSIEGPIGEDFLKARVSGRYSFNGGHYENNNVPGQNLGQEETWSVGATVVHDSSDNIYFKLRGFYYEDDDGPAASFAFNRTFNNFGPLMNVFFDDAGNPIGNGIAAFQGVLPQVSDDMIGLNTSEADVDALITALNGSPSPILGGFSVAETGFGLNRRAGRFSFQTTIGIAENVDFDFNMGYAFDKSLLISDFDSTDLLLSTTINGREFEDVSFEARFSGALLDDRLQWSLGGNYFDLDFRDINRFLTFNFAPFPLFFGSGQPNDIFIENYAGFGQLEYALTDRINVSFEGRYQVDKIDGFVAGTQIAGSPQEFTNFLPRATIDFQPLDGTLLYASYSKGNLPGGFNRFIAALTPAQRASLATVEPDVGDAYDEEELINYEIGWKQSVADRLDFSIAAFYMDRRDQQVTALVRFPDATSGTGFTAVTATRNQQTTEIKGFEFEGNWSPVDILSLRGTVAFVDSTIDSFPAGADAGEFEDVFGNRADPSGQQAPIYPKWQGSLSATLSDELPMNWIDGTRAGWFIRGDMFYRGNYFTGTANLGQAPASSVVNLRAGVSSETMDVELFVTNLTDEDAYTAASTVRDAANFVSEANLVGLRDKRQFGLRMTARF